MSYQHILTKNNKIKGLWNLQTGVFPENIEPLSLHHMHEFKTL